MTIQERDEMDKIARLTLAVLTGGEAELRVFLAHVASAKSYSFLVCGEGVGDTHSLCQTLTTVRDGDRIVREVAIRRMQKIIRVLRDYPIDKETSV